MTQYETNPAEILTNLFKEWSGEDGVEIASLPEAGSYRKYFRLTGHKSQAVGVYSPDVEENRAFLGFTEHFRNAGLNVPEVFKVSSDQKAYLLSDLGDVSLLKHLEQNRINGFPDDSTISLYKKVIEHLVAFQVSAGKTLNYDLCYPVNAFDARSMRWDLNYFKYYFLRLLRIPFNEHALEDDFDRFVEKLLQVDSAYFMYRDFQARNILIDNEEPWFIDYQGGRKGPLQYDLASLLFQVKAALPYEFREEMLQWYILCLQAVKKTDAEAFEASYYDFVLIRLLQAMGAYGFRGYYEHRAHFLQSIPYAIENVQWLLQNNRISDDLPELRKVLQLISSSDFSIPRIQQSDTLTVSINSFSFRNNIPPDFTGNGGGFVFDCRILPNPGRYDHFKQLNGTQQPVQQFMEKEQRVDKFMQNVKRIIDQAILEYNHRGYTHLQVNFGCTGGQHRSVYCAEKLSEYINDKYPVNVITTHTNLRKPWFNMPVDSSINKPETA